MGVGSAILESVEAHLAAADLRALLLEAQQSLAITMSDLGTATESAHT